MENLMKVYAKLLAANPHIVIAGSLSLKIQGIKIPREPKDVDVMLPRGTTFNSCIEGLKYNHDSEDNGYFNDEYYRSQWELYGVKVDVFERMSTEWSPRTVYCDVWMSDHFEKRKCVHWSEVLRQKTLYAFAYHVSALKHIDDVCRIIHLNKYSKWHWFLYRVLKPIHKFVNVFRRK